MAGDGDAVSRVRVYRSYRLSPRAHVVGDALLPDSYGRAWSLDCFRAVKQVITLLFLPPSSDHHTPAMAYTLYSLIIAQHPPTTQDYRLGDLGIDWIDYHSEKEIPQDVPPPPKDIKRPGDDAPPRRFTQGTTALGPGIVHLFRHAAQLLPDEGSKAEGEDGTLVAVLAVPRWMVRPLLVPGLVVALILGVGLCRVRRVVGRVEYPS